MKSIIKLNFTHERKCDLIVFPQSGLLASTISHMGFGLDFEILRVLPDAISVFLDKVKSLEKGNPAKNEDYDSYMNGFCESVAMRSQLVILSYRQRDLFIYKDGNGIQVTAAILKKLEKALRDEYEKWNS